MEYILTVDGETWTGWKLTREPDEYHTTYSLDACRRAAAHYAQETKSVPVGLRVDFDGTERHRAWVTVPKYTHIEVKVA